MNRRTPARAMEFVQIPAVATGTSTPRSAHRRAALPELDAPTGPPSLATQWRSVRTRTFRLGTRAALKRASLIEALRAQPTMTVEEAAFVLGISRASAYNAVDDGEIKIKLIGRRKLVLTRPLFASLGYED